MERHRSASRRLAQTAVLLTLLFALLVWYGSVAAGDPPVAGSIADLLEHPAAMWVVSGIAIGWILVRVGQHWRITRAGITSSTADRE